MERGGPVATQSAGCVSTGAMSSSRCKSSWPRTSTMPPHGDGSKPGAGRGNETNYTATIRETPVPSRSSSSCLRKNRAVDGHPVWVSRLGSRNGLSGAPWSPSSRRSCPSRCSIVLRCRWWKCRRPKLTICFLLPSSSGVVEQIFKGPSEAQGSTAVCGAEHEPAGSRPEQGSTAFGGAEHHDLLGFLQGHCSTTFYGAVHEAHERFQSSTARRS